MEWTRQIARIVETKRLRMPHPRVFYILPVPNECGINGRMSAGRSICCCRRPCRLDDLLAKFGVARKSTNVFRGDLAGFILELDWATISAPHKSKFVRLIQMAGQADAL